MPPSATPAPASHLATEPAGTEYVPGVCNIGPWEVRRRVAFGIVGLVVAGLLLLALIAIGAPPVARLLVVLPAWGGAFSVLQARRRFCGAYALRGISNFGDSHATIRTVEDEAAHRADMDALARMTRDSFVFALVVGVVAVLLPR